MRWLGLIFLLLPLLVFADEKNSPLNPKQEEILKLFMPSLFKNNNSTTTAVPTGSLLSLITVNSVSAMGNMNDTEFVMRLAQKTYYEISSDDSHQILTLSLDNIDPHSTIPPINVDNLGIQKIVVNYTPENQMVMTFLLMPGVDVKALNMTGDNPAQLVLSLGKVNLPHATPEIKNIPTPGPYEPLVKKPEPLSPDELLQNNMNKALDYLDQNKPTEALTVLKIQPLPEMNSHTDYYTVLAETYRQSNHPLDAIKIYQSLLNIDATNATWWVGLGMCFDMLNQKEAAHEAYMKANTLGHLPLALQQYISKQITQGASTS